VSDGLIAVGQSYVFGNGDWVGVTGNGSADAIIVKYDNDGNVVWKKNFGGSGVDHYESVTAVSDGLIAVGKSSAFGGGDWTGIIGKGLDDAIIVKYDNNGNVVWKKSLGGSGYDCYNSVTALSDGIVAAGSGRSSGSGGAALIVKYDNSGNVIWEKNFGGTGGDYFKSITVVSGGIVAVGHSNPNTFNTGDWKGISGKGLLDSFIVKFDNNGNVVWKKNFGGSGSDAYDSVTAVSNGIVAVGWSDVFGKGDWSGVSGKGSTDAIIVKYDNNGNVVWKKNFGGGDIDCFMSVTTVSDGIVAVGASDAFGKGDWSGVAGKGITDAIIVKYDNNGNVVWKKNFGGSNGDEYKAVTAVPGGVAAAGRSWGFGSGDWAGVTGNGGIDAIIVKYTSNILVTDITGVPSTAVANTPLALTGTVVPSDATYNMIVWSVKSAGTTGASISGNVLSTTGTGTAVVTATIYHAAASNTDFKKDFTISVGSTVSNVNIAATADSMSTISPSGTVAVPKGSNQAFAFSAKAGYSLSSVKVDGTALTQQQMALGSYTFTNVTVAHTIDVKSVAPAPKNFYITATADSNSVISPSGQSTVQKDNHKTFTFSAKAGYYVSSVTVDGAALSQQQISSGQYTFYYVLANHTIDVKSLRLVDYYITATANSFSIISPSGTVAVLNGTSQTFTFSAEAGFFVSSVTVDGLALSQPEISQGKYTFTNVTANHTIEVKSIRKIPPGGTAYYESYWVGLTEYRLMIIPESALVTIGPLFMLYPKQALADYFRELMSAFSPVPPEVSVLFEAINSATMWTKMKQASNGDGVIVIIEVPIIGIPKIVSLAPQTPNYFGP
jgi:hypothetical protein